MARQGGGLALDGAALCLPELQRGELVPFSIAPHIGSLAPRNTLTAASFIVSGTGSQKWQRNMTPRFGHF